MKIKNLSAEITHDGEVVIISFQVPVAGFHTFIESLKGKKKIVAKAVAVDLQERRDVLFKIVNDYRKANPKKYPDGLYVQFFNYWGTANKAGTKIKYDNEQFFSMGGRMATFARNAESELPQLWKEHHESKKQEPTLFNS